MHVLEAQHRIRARIERTPMIGSPALSAACNGDVRLKLETLQPIGSFKLRGATNAIMSLPVDRRPPSVITASSGNHGIAVAAAARHSGLSATILVGRTIPDAKLRALRRYETERIHIEVLDVGSDEAELVARDRAARAGSTYISPYNDPLVIAGQGTAALEILEDWPECDCIIAPIGGGGLIAGLGVWAKTIKPALRLVGVQPAASPTLAHLLSEGAVEPIEIGPTLADGVAGNVEPGSITIDLCRQLLDEVVIIGEEAITAAIRWAFTEHNLVLEGSAALGIAALQLHSRPDLVGRRTAVLVTGQLIDHTTFARIIQDDR